MALYVFNSLTSRKEEFKPINPPHVGMYVCGVTVYDYSHIGHARAYIAFDVIYRYLTYKGYKVTYVRNFTDIDDKIIRRANEEGKDIREVSERYIQAFTEDMDALGLIHPDVEPRCTEYIDRMQEFIKKLIEDGYAYATPSGNVYYRVKKFKGYGKLSGKRLEDLIAGASERLSSEEAAEKEEPFDFALWKASKEGEPWWNSPWGKGRPGWHIECSVMSTANIGETLDIHGGGKDLIFPHHENEIAQSEAYTGKPFAKYWLHNGFVNVPSQGGEATKMSKSLGNFYTVRDVLNAYHPQAIKLFMLSTSYRNDILFTEEGLSRAQNRIRYFYETLLKVDAMLAKLGEPPKNPEYIEPELVENLIPAVEEAMDDDFNTQKALSELSEPFRLMNELCDKPKSFDRKKLHSTLHALRQKVRDVSGIFGILDKDPKTTLLEIRDLQMKFLDITKEEIEKYIEERAAARKERNFARADEIRDMLLQKGVELRDTPNGTEWTLREK